MSERTYLEDAIAHAVRAAVRGEFREALRQELEEFRSEIREMLGSGGGGGERGRLLTPKEAARLAGVKADTIRTWVKRGHLSRYEAGGRLRIDPRELMNHLRRDTAPKEADVIDFDSRAARILGED